MIKHMPDRNHARFRRRGLAVFFILVVVAAYVGLVYAQPFSTLHPELSYRTVSAAETQPALAWPGYGEAAVGAIGYGVLATHGKQAPIPTASIAKVITALAVLKQRPLQPGESGPTLVLTQADVDSYFKYISMQGSVVGVGVGERISEYQALEAMLLPSANNMAETLARWAFGSIDAYNQYANNFVQELGLTSIKVTDPSGFQPTTMASAGDLVTLGQIAMLNPVFAQIVAEPSAVVPVQGTIQNYNFLLGKDGNIGIKTGNNDQDPGAYLFAFKQAVGSASVTIVGAVMGGPNLPTVMKDAKALAASAAKYFKQTTFIHAGDVIGSYDANGESIQAVAARDLTLTTWEGYTFASTAALNTLRGAHKSGESVGRVTLTNTSTRSSDSVPVVLKQNINPPGLVYRLTHPF